jgi:hypothetical protein
MAAALARSRSAIAMMTVHRAAIAQSDGLIYRGISPSPVIEYGAAYTRDDPSPALANLLKIVDEVVPPLPIDPPPGTELIWVRPGTKVAV